MKRKSQRIVGYNPSLSQISSTSDVYAAGSLECAKKGGRAEACSYYLQRESVEETRLIRY
ncbi:hypothetical protein J6590_039221 [Homalodisca vitripennis]|nr:hypothetical protein J6590_039221 [Homalodisca vitripennis]